MYNRYQGNSGRVERVPDAPQPSIRPHPPAPPAGNNKPPAGGGGAGLFCASRRSSAACRVSIFSRYKFTHRLSQCMQAGGDPSARPPPEKYTI